MGLRAFVLICWRRGGGSGPECEVVCYQGGSEAVGGQEVFGDQHQWEQLNRGVADYGGDFAGGDRGAHLVGPVVTRVGGSLGEIGRTPAAGGGEAAVGIL